MPDVLAVGHRGAPRVATENTLPSIAAAAAARADWVEVDVKLSRERTPVLLHDSDLRRIWGRPEPVRLVGLDDLPGRSTQGEDRVPTLAEALDTSRGLGVTLMIDLPGVEEAEATADLVLGGDRADDVVFTGDPDALAYVRTRSDSALIAMSWEHPELPHAALLAAVSPQWFNQRSDLLDTDAIRGLHRRGMAVSTYTVDDPARMIALAEAGVDAIISNDVARLVAVLHDRVDGAEQYAIR